MTPKRLDVIYVTASARDGRFTRICVASIRHFYPDAQVKLLIGGRLEDGLEHELARYWDVFPADVPHADWGWGFVKLEPLFGRSGERFLVLDSDTVFAGPVLNNWIACKGDFLVDDEVQTEADTHRLYYDWRKVTAVDPAALAPRFVFNSGQWFGTAGILSRRDFELFVDWSAWPPKLIHSGLFMPGDQGVLNYILNQRVGLSGLAVDRRAIMQWPGYGLEGFTANTIANGSAPPRIIHWAGYKRARLGDLPGSDILHFFEKLYYQALPRGSQRRWAAAVRHPMEFWGRNIATRATSRLGRK